MWRKTITITENWMGNNTSQGLEKTIGTNLDAPALHVHVWVEQAAILKADVDEMRLQQLPLHPHSLLLLPVPLFVILPSAKDHEQVYY
jgi:hypothetical protein